MSERFWHSSTQAQKLAQVDAGIELGMSARQVAMASGLAVVDDHNLSNLVRCFAIYHGRKMPDAIQFALAKSMKSAYRRGDLGRDRRAFFRGDAVDFWQEPSPSKATDELEEMSF